MTKTSKNIQSIKEFLKKLTNIDLIVCLSIVTLLFIPTLVRPWLIYDERIISEGIYFPTAKTFGEIFEIIESFGLNFNVNSSNTIYTSNHVTRTCPLAQVFGIIISFFFNKNPFLFHIFNLTLHLINTCLVYFILKTILGNTKRVLLIILTTIWAVHPVVMEPVLLSINCGATFSYMFFFALLLDFLINKENGVKTDSDFRTILIPIIFLIPMLINEYIIALPLIIFIFSFYSTYKLNPFKKAFKLSIKETKPYFYGLILYVIYFLFLTKYRTSQAFLGNELIVFLERVFWLAPQIFFHMINLVIYPKVLSIDQTLFVKLGKTLFDPYSIFCIVFLASWLFIPLLMFILKRKLANVFLLSWTFFFALLPFLHILMPSYTLSAERYLYTPLALLIFGVAKKLSNGASARLAPTAPTLSILFSIILILCLTRSHFRTLDWKDNYTFINSTYETSNNNLFKAMRLGMFGKAITVLEPNNRVLANEYFLKTLDLLQKAKEENKILKSKYQKNLPLVIKSYGLDYDSLLSKIAFLEASSRSLELNEGHKVGLDILKPFMKKPERVEPRVLELYWYFLVLDKEYDKAEKILLKTNSLYPNTSFILTNLIEFYTTYKNDRKTAEEYLTLALKNYPYEIGFLIKAIGFYEKINPPSTAHLLYLLGLRTQSEIAYRQALSLYTDLGQIRDARRVAYKLERFFPKNPDTLYILSDHYYKTNDQKKALLTLIDAYSLVKTNNSNPRTAFNITNTLAKLYLQFGNKEKAIWLTQDLLTFAGNDVEALAKLANLYKTLGLTENLNQCISKIQSLNMGTKG